MNMHRHPASSRLPGILRTLLLLAIGPTLLAQVRWQSLPVSPNGPPLRNVGTMEFVHTLNRTLLYSGWHPSLYLTDLWSWDGSTWTLLDPATPPGTRWGHAMTYDLLRDRLVVFGGARGSYINDTWELNPQTMAWTQAQPIHAPTPRVAMSFAFDVARGVTVLFGGTHYNSHFDETWEWNGINWVQRTFAVNPGARSSHAMTYDQQRQRIVMFGGITGFGGAPVLNDTWEYDGTSWLQMTPTVSPAPRGTHAMTWDPLRERTVLYGGNSLPWNSIGVMLDETWEWDGTTWLQRATAASPANAWERCMTYDYASGQILLFGGGAAFDETWSYEPTHRPTAYQFGSGCAGSLGVPTLHSSGPLPWLGDTLSITVSPTPTTGAILVIGFANTNPVSLQPLGLPGCYSFVTYDAATFAAAVGSQANWSLTIPNQVGLLGVQLHQQAGVLDSLATGGAAVSNALSLTVGGR